MRLRLLAGPHADGEVCEGCVCVVCVYGRKNQRTGVVSVLPHASALPPHELAVT